jgi:hypothetical protein
MHPPSKQNQAPYHGQRELTRKPSEETIHAHAVADTSSRTVTIS